MTGQMLVALGILALFVGLMVAFVCDVAAFARDQVLDDLWDDQDEELGA